MFSNMASKTDANGITIGYTYDALKRLTQKSYPDNSTETYTYDAAGRLLTATNKNISYTFIYDTAGRMTNVSDNRGYALAYEYDTMGLRTKTTLQKGTPDERITTYGYDNANRPSTITANAGTFTYAYDSLGRRGSTTYPNGITATYAYDTLNRLKSLTHAAGATTIAFANYSGFDKVGNRTNKATTNGSEQYNYDTIYRLIQAVVPKGTENYIYDAVGNRLTGPGPKDTKYQYNAGNQMTMGMIYGHGYDNNGNQISRTTTNSDKSWVYTWDYENRLIKSDQTKGTEKRTVTFNYDPQGRRIGKTLTTTIKGVTKTYTWTYVYDNDNIALEIYTNDAGVTEKTFYTHGASTDEHLALERNGSYYYYHADGLGSITSVTDNNKNVVQTYQYDVFGAVTPSAGFRDSYTYTGREWDKETGLYYYRARYYDPMEGRFVSRDPISFSGDDVNLYGYTKNNPINSTDSLGLFGIGGGFGATLGLVSISTSINYKECCSNGKRHKRTVRTWCIGYELGLSLKGTNGAKGSGGSSASQTCSASSTYTYENGTQVWGALILGTSYSASSNSNSVVTGLGGGISFYEQCTDTVIADVVTNECCN